MLGLSRDINYCFRFVKELSFLVYYIVFFLSLISTFSWFISLWAYMVLTLCSKIRKLSADRLYWAIPWFSRVAQYLRPCYSATSRRQIYNKSITNQKQKFKQIFSVYKQYVNIKKLKYFSYNIWVVLFPKTFKTFKSL